MDAQRERITGGIAADEPFWQSLSDGQFRLPRCGGCGQWMWPAHWRCGECGSWAFDWVDVVPVGTIYSWTRTWYAFDRTKERAADLPYVVVLVEVDGTDGARVMGIFESDDPPAVGMRVAGIIEPAGERSKWYPSVVWRPDGGAR